MTRKEELLALTERVEALIEPDREVDAAIQRALGSDNGEHWFCGAGGQLTKDDLAPTYTACLNAARSLVPTEHNWSVQYSDLTKGEAWVFPPNNDDLVQFYAEAATPELALTAAALRALAEQEPC